MAAAQMYRHITIETSGSGSKGLWVWCSLKKIQSLSFGTKEYVVRCMQHAGENKFGSVTGA